MQQDYLQGYILFLVEARRKSEANLCRKTMMLKAPASDCIRLKFSVVESPLKLEEFLKSLQWM